MIDNKDFEFIKEKFDGDGLKAPESLSADDIMQKLETAPQQESSGSDFIPKKPVHRRKWFRPVIAVAACFALAIGIVPLTRSSEPVMSGDLEQYSSYNQLNKKVNEMIGERPEQLLSYGVDYAVSNEAEAVAGKGDDEVSDHSETYTQVEGVDESDIVKTDGKYIYFTSYIENQVIIAKASNGKAERIGAISANKIGALVEEMYIRDGKLIVLGSDYDNYNDIDFISNGSRSFTTVTVFDVSDPSEPKKLTQYSQTGSLLSSRMIGKELCLVTNDYIFSYKRNLCVPYVCYGKDEPERLQINDICGIPMAIDPSYTVIGCMDTESGKADHDSIKTKAVLGGSSEIYCNGSNLYVASNVVDPSENSVDESYYFDRSKTCILKVSLKGGKVSYKNTATVDGQVNDQFSMDESNGYFKVAVTSNVNGTDANSLYIFDKQMKEVGSIRNFARDEHIEAVRYVKDKAYVITYEQTDPLFIIDLKDPANPVIEGHVKISGFSTLLVPVDEDHLLGFGFSTETTEMGEATNGMKLALFNINDPSNPKVADSKEFVDMDSEIQYNHKALLVGPKASYYAVPFQEWQSDDSYGVLFFTAKTGKLDNFKKLQTSEYVNRCIYIEDYIYAICDDDSIEGFSIP